MLWQINGVKMTTYKTFLSAFGDQHSFQTFCDKGKNKRLIKQLHGTIEEHFHELAKLNQQGAGVYFTVNETNLQGRTTKHITKVRAVFCDFDGTPLPEKFNVTPHLIVNTSKNKYHVYWLVSDMPLESFTLYQQALASKYGSDRAVKDLPRIMRVAGMWHNKKKPYPVKIIHEEISSPYKMTDIRDGLELQRPQKKIFKYVPTQNKKFTGTVSGVGQGDRHAKLVKMLIAMRLRGEDIDYARNEALTFGSKCNPPEDPDEILFQLHDIWGRYGAA